MLVFYVIHFYYVINFKSNYIGKLDYDINNKNILVYEIGEPKFPFGSTKARLIYNNSYKDISINNDGTHVNLNNFKIISNNKNEVKIKIRGNDDSHYIETIYLKNGIFKEN